MKGDPTCYNFLVNMLLSKDLSITDNYALLKEYADVEKFTDYLLVSWWTAVPVDDWPGNNFYTGN